MQAESAGGSVRRTMAVCAVFFIAALVVRLAYLVQFKSSPFFDPRATGLDPLLYHEMASRIASGEWLGKGVFEVMPFYGYFLGAAYAVFGRGVEVAYALQALLGASTVVLLYLFVRHLADERVAVLAAAGGIVCQSLAFHVGMIGGETLAVFLTVAMLFILSIAIERRRVWYFFVAGLVTGMGVLTRGTFVIFIIIFVIWYSISELRRSFSRVLLHCMALVLGTVIVVAPVTIHNAVVGNDFVVVTAHDGINIYLGNNPHARGSFNPVPQLGINREEILHNAKRIAEREEGRSLKPSEVSRYWKREAIEYIRAHPFRFIQLVGEKVIAFVNAYEISDVISLQTMKKFSSLLQYGLLPFGFIAPFAIFGMVVSVRRKKFAPVYLFVVANLIAVIITFVNARYRLTVVPLFLIFAGVSLVWLKDNLKYRWRLIAGVVGVVLSFLVVHRPLTAGDQPAVSAYNLANAYSYMGRKDLAEKEFKQAIHLEPSYISARYALGMLYWEQRNVEDAEQQFLAILKLKPDHVKSLNQLGNICLFRDNKKCALAYWERSLAIDHDQPEVSLAIKRNKLR